MKIGTDGQPIVTLTTELNPDESNRELTDAELDATVDENGVEMHGDDSDHDVITIGEPPEGTSASNDDSEQQAAPQWAKDLRKDNRRLHKELADERRKNAAVAAAHTQPDDDTLGAAPTLESCGWDEAEFRKQTAEHVRKEAAIEAKREQRTAAIAKQQADSRGRVTLYRDNATKLRVQDFDEAEDVAVTHLSETQQNIILHGADNAAVLVYAIGKNPTKAAELAKIEDPVRFAFAVAKLEKEIKVTPRKSAKPEPEQIPTRSASLSGGGGTALEAARKKAEQSGDYTEVNRLKRMQREAARKR